MKLCNLISAARVGHLMRRDITENAVKIYTVTGASAGILILLSIYRAYTGILSYQLYTTFFSVLLILAGLIVTSGSFREMHRKGGSQHFLLLPASHFEKFLSRLLLTTAGLSFATLFGVVIVSYISEGLNTLVFNRHNAVFDPFAPEVWSTIARYTVLQSIFFLGAVYFKKHNFIKTVNVLLAALFILSIAIALLLKVFHAETFNPYFILHTVIIPAVQTIRIVLWVVTAPLFWSIAYIRITKAEVRNAV